MVHCHFGCPTCAPVQVSGWNEAIEGHFGCKRCVGMLLELTEPRESNVEEMERQPTKTRQSLARGATYQ